MRRYRAKPDLVKDLVLIFALDELPIAIRLPSFRFGVGVSYIGIGLKFKRGFFWRVPTPETVFIQVHALSRSCETRSAHKLFVTRQNDLCRTAGFRRRNADYGVQFDQKSCTRGRK